MRSSKFRARSAGEGVGAASSDVRNGFSLVDREDVVDPEFCRSCDLLKADAGSDGLRLRVCSTDGRPIVLGPCSCAEVLAYTCLRPGLRSGTGGDWGNVAEIAGRDFKGDLGGRTGLSSIKNVPECFGDDTMILVVSLAGDTVLAGEDGAELRAATEPKIWRGVSI